LSPTWLGVYLLGIEAYGLVGVFATIQVLAGLLDLGLGTTIGRELAHRSHTHSGRLEQRDLVRTLEVIYLTLSLIVAIAIVLSANAIVDHWLHIGQLPRASVVLSIRLMGVAAAVQFAGSFYQGGLMGLERQALANIITIIMGTVRSGGAILVLLVLHGGIVAFFVWQLIAGVIQTAVSAIALWRSLPAGHTPAFRVSLLHAVWRFSLWVSASALIGACVTQADKIVLTRLLPLEQYGYYTLAGAAAGMLWAFILPVNQALYPRLARLHAVGDESALEAVYHRSCQAIAVIMLPAAIIVALFSYELIFVWTGSHSTAENTHVLVTLLVAGTAVNGILSMPALLQSAAGWPGLMAVMNAVIAVFIVPTIYALVSHFGAAGAATTWLLVNVVSLVVTVPIMHRRLLRGQLRKWALSDVVYPLVGTLALGVLARYLLPPFESRLLLVTIIGSIYLVLVIVCGLSTTHFRELAREFAEIGRQAAVTP